MLENAKADKVHMRVASRGLVTVFGVSLFSPELSVDYV